MTEKLFWENPKGQSFHYLRYIPRDLEPGEKRPLVFFLHGAGERGPEDGSELDRVFRYFWLGRAEKGEEFPFLMLAPQCPDGKYWGSFLESLNRFLDEALQTLPADEKRVSLTGLSMGGTGTWLWALSDPERFSAFAPVCGTGVYWYGGQLIHKPVWAFHGDVDEVVPPEESLSMIRSINKRGGKARLTLFHGVGHDSWVGAYEGDVLMKWLTEKSLED